MSISRRTAAAAASTLALLSAPSAWAETLTDAIALAYASNPTLQEQRARLRSLDESYVQARQGFRPEVNLQGSVNYDQVNAGSGQGQRGLTGFQSADGESNSGVAQLNLSQPLYTGGRVSNALRAAEANILVGRENLRSVEQSVLLTVIQAYSDVLRDTESLRIREENVGVLRRQLEEAQARFEVGEITRTDVAQSEARLAAAQALLAQAQAQLAISRSSYAEVVGQNPGDLEPPPVLAGIPATVDQAFDIGQASNPALRSSEFSERASRAQVAQARSDLRPSVSLQGSYGASGEVVPFSRTEYGQALSVSGVFTQPLYSGGVRRSRVRQATEENSGDRIAVEATRRQVLQDVSQAWNQFEAARASITSNEEQVRAARIAAEGVREEASVGLRTTLDVLNAELELRNAQLSVAQSRRDSYVSQANLLSAMGRLEAANLVPGVELYDPSANFERVKNKGSAPWDPLVEQLDEVASPKPGPQPANIRATSGQTLTTRR